MYSSRPQIRRRLPISKLQTRLLVDDVWRSTWPFITTTILASFLIISILIIGALETASLAISTDTNLYGKTSSTGAGFWCEFYVFIAAALIITLDFVVRTRLWATIALIATIMATSFSAIIIGLDAKAIQDANDHYSSLPKKSQVLAAQLAIACLQVVLCGFYVGIYMLVYILAYYRLRSKRRG